MLHLVPCPTASCPHFSLEFWHSTICKEYKYIQKDVLCLDLVHPSPPECKHTEELLAILGAN